MRSEIWLAVAASLMAQAAGAATLPSRVPGLWQSFSIVRGPDGAILPNAGNVVTVTVTAAVVPDMRPMVAIWLRKRQSSGVADPAGWPMRRLRSGRFGRSHTCSGSNWPLVAKPS